MVVPLLRHGDAEDGAVAARLVRLLLDGVQAVGEHRHDGLVDLFGLDVPHDGIGGTDAFHLDAQRGDVGCSVVLERLDRLLAQLGQVGGLELHGALLEQFLHRLERTRRGESVLLDLLQVRGHHIRDIEAVLVGIRGDVFLLILNVRLHVLRQAEGQVREVVDVVHRIEDTVDEALGQLADGRLSLLA